jgi:hypothetical protein
MMSSAEKANGNPSVPSLQRLTTQYMDVEDRMRITGAASSGEAIVIWLTQRLLSRLLPHLLKQLQAQTASAAAAPVNAVQTEMVQTFAQQAARAQLPEQAPVQVKPESHSWLAESIDVTTKNKPDESSQDQRIKFVFKGINKEQASVIMPSTQLRQWLNILHDQWMLSGWPMSLWPDWVTESMPARGVKSQISLH